jgi:hypothetical protein
MDKGNRPLLHIVVISVAFQILIFASFLAMLVLLCRIRVRPGWGMRTAIYGWGLTFLGALLFSILLPMWLKGSMDSKTLHATFPDGTIVAAALFGGWSWPVVVVVCRQGWERSRRMRNQMQD